MAIILKSYGKKKFKIELNERELDLILNSLKEMPFSVVELYGKKFTNLIKKLEKKIR